MKRSEFNRVLSEMEMVREWSYEAGSKSEEKRLITQYARLSRTIRPYLEGRKALVDDDPQDHAPL